MKSVRRGIAIVGLAAVLGAGVGVGPITQPAYADRYAAHESRGFNDEYIFAATRGVNDWQDVHPALKVTLFPVTIILDTIFLPFAVVAGFVS